MNRWFDDIFCITEIGSPIKIILKLKGDVKAIHIGLEGIYILNRFNLLNGKPFWEHKKNVSTKIWYNGKNGTMWNIGTAIYSIEHTVGPLETTSWLHYNENGSDSIPSTDLTLESGNNFKLNL